MPATPPVRPVDATRLQYKRHIRQLAARLDHLSKQVQLDLANDRTLVSNGRQAAEVAMDLHAALSVLAVHDEQAARARTVQAARRAEEAEPAA